MSHWAFEIADKLITNNPNKEEYICAAGISPSGSVHIGNFRDIATSMFVVKALQKKGKKAKLLLSWDDFDRLRKVPSNVSKIIDNFEENLGKPYTFISDPFNDSKSYAEHFEKEFEKSLKDMNIIVDIRRQTDYYTSGKYREQIKHSLAKRKEIYDIIMRFKTQESNEEERELYYPISIYCDKSRKDNTKVISYNETTGELKYFCKDCGTIHIININDYNLIKLIWKVDWPMRWQYEGVDFEPGGIDHASANGSYDVSKVIAKEIFNYEAPVFQGYGWLGIKGLGNMHSSTGNNITPDKVLDIYEPEIVKWLFAKYKPGDSFDFAFDETVNRHYSEFDKLIEKYNNFVADDFEKDLVYLIFGDVKPSEKVSFGTIASLAPIVDFNSESLKKVLNKVGVNFDDNSLCRLKKVKSWIEEYNPDKKYIPLQEFNHEYFNELDEEEKVIVEKLFNFITNNETFNDKQIQQFLYDIINNPNLSKKENIERQKKYFKNIYNLIFGRNDGPRLYLFLAAANKSSYIDLLNGNNKK